MGCCSGRERSEDQETISNVRANQNVLALNLKKNARNEEMLMTPQTNDKSLRAAQTSDSRPLIENKKNSLKPEITPSLQKKIINQKYTNEDYLRIKETPFAGKYSYETTAGLKSKQNDKKKLDEDNKFFNDETVDRDSTETVKISDIRRTYKIVDNVEGAEIESEYSFT